MTVPIVRMAKQIDRSVLAQAEMRARIDAVLKILREKRGCSTEGAVGVVLSHPDENIRAAAFEDICSLIGEVKITPEVVRASREADAILAEALAGNRSSTDMQTPLKK